MRIIKESIYKLKTTFPHYSHLLPLLPSHLTGSSISNTFYCTLICQNSIQSVPLAIGLEVVYYELLTFGIRLIAILVDLPSPWMWRCTAFSTN
jgi:hypothetical protein